MRVWQPIETAPKDGTIIDLWLEGSLGPDGKPYTFRSPDCYAESPAHNWISPVHGDWEYGQGSLWGYRPTHWMERPEPPQ